MTTSVAIALPPAPSPNHVARAAFAAVLGSVTGQQAEDILKIRHSADDRAMKMLTRSTVAPGSTTGSGWATELARNTWRNFLIGLAPQSAAARLIELGMPAQLGGAQVKMPGRSGAPATCAWVAESSPIPVSSRGIDLVSIGPMKKMGVILVMSRELAKRADGEAVFEILLREDAAKSIDAAYFSADSGTTARHAGLLYGLTSLTAFGGGDELAMKTDVAALLNAIASGGSGQAVLVMSLARAMNFPVKFPHVAAGLTVLASPAVADTRVIAVDPLSLIHATDTAPDILASTEAVLHMSDDPLAIAESGVADPVRSLFQTDAIALRMLADIAFAKRRGNAVAFLDNPTW